MTMVTPRRPVSWYLVIPFPIALAFATPGCNREPPLGGASAGDDFPGVTVRDSAGIEIVENHVPEWPAEQFWTLDPEPEIVLGGDESLEPEAGDSTHLIWQVTGVARLADGRVAVLSEGNRTILLFEPSGRFSKSIGRGGRGPGEFSAPQHLQYLPPDTLAVWDAHYGSVAYFDTAGTLLRHRLIDLGAMMAAISLGNATERATPLGDGSFVAHVSRRDFRVPPPPPGQPFRPPVEYVRIDSTYAAHSLGSWEGFERSRIGVVEGVLYPPVGPLFFVQSHLAGGGDPLLIYVSNGDENEIRQFSPEGALLRIIRRTTDPIPISAEEREAKEAGRLARNLEAIPPQDFHPPVNGLHVDMAGYLWVVDARNRFSVFSPKGRWLGTLDAPPGLTCFLHGRPCWIGEDLFLRLARDEMNVQRIEGYRLNRRTL